MDTVNVFASVAIIIGIGFLAEVIFRKTNIPDVLVLILVGVLIGPVAGWVSPDSLGNGTVLFTSFALLFILFQGALSIHFHELLDSLRKTLTLTLSSFLIATCCIAAVGFIILRDLPLAILLGTILGGTSSAIVIPLARNLKSAARQSTVLTLESAINDVLCIVAAIAVMKAVQTGTAQASMVFKSLLSSFSLAIVIGVVAGFLWVVLLERYLILRDAHILSIGVVVGLYAFVESPFVEASGAIAALAFGLVLGNSKSVLHAVFAQRHKSKKIALPMQDVLSEGAKSFFAEISFFVKVFFFVYLGVLFDFSDPMLLLFGALIAAAVYATRPAAVRLAFDSTLSDKERTMLEILIPKGLAAAVLAQLAVQNGVPGAELVVGLVIPTVIVSILLTGALAFATERGWFRGFWGAPKRHRKVVEQS